ncbi:MAG: single-stranded-DNA-specific exonuclease RecJ [Candidatus Curtissbacteria bacterium]|nr:single-stranded-DNA-specific exonuclease RecJ [Candidatus Curtissbacteria bacterium]
MTKFVWKVKSKAPIKKNKDWLLKILAENRGLTTPKKIKDFLNPTIDQILEVKISDLEKGKKRVITAIKAKEKCVVYSDYDADGLNATAIMWETLYDLGANILPYVPHRITEGYGLSKAGIEKLAREGVKLIITVDNGVTAVEQVDFAKSLGVDVVITDHHVLPKIPPKSYALVHTTELCGAGVSWRFCWQIIETLKPDYKEKLTDKLELAAIATVADLMPLVGANRAVVKLGLEKLRKTKRPGIKALITESRINGPITTYEIGHIIAPRINAMGRIEHGIDALRLLCAKSEEQANSLAKLLGKTNVRRQDLTIKAVDHAISMVDKSSIIGVISHEEWHEGIIGLVASRLVEAHYRPMIVISKGVTFSKGSARSIAGFNIVEAIRESSEYLVDGGGHPMAAGFTIETKHIEMFKEKIIKYAESKITEEILTPTIEVECELEKEDMTEANVKAVGTFEPYGIANPLPLFLTRRMIVEDVRGVGPQSRHLKLQLDGIGAIGFNIGNMRTEIRPGSLIDLVYTLEDDKYAGNGTIQLKIRDLVVNSN